MKLILIWSLGLGIALAKGSTAFSATVQPANQAIQLPLSLPVSGYGLAPALGGLVFDNPVVITSPPGETNRLFVAERAGRIVVVTNLANPTKSVFLDLSAQTYSGYAEAGLLGLTFHPGFATNGYFFVFRSLTRDTPGYPNTLHQQVSRFQITEADPNQAPPESEQVLIAQVDYSDEHNGGDLAFGPDGYLYISFGRDGPPPKDRSDQLQAIDNGFFGGIARIDVDQRPGSLPANPGAPNNGFYAIPPDNPFVGVQDFNGVPVRADKLRTELYAVGLRNPWRMSFDPITGRLFCGDVGESAWEEIDLIQKGGNYGWPFLEANDVLVPSDILTVPPYLTYPHGYGSRQGLAVVGGLVYHGEQFADLSGAYIFGDYGSGNIWALNVNEETPSDWRFLTGERGISAFGTDPSTGEVLVANHTTGAIRRLIYVAPETVTSIPQTLAETGVFSDIQSLQVQPGMLPYSVNVPFWSDGAIKSRWFGLPDAAAKIQVQPDGTWQFPPGTVWVKHFDLELTEGDPTSRRRMETRVLVKSPDGVYGLTYHWGDSLTNATLVQQEGLEENFLIHSGGTVRTQTWEYPSRVQCLFCHTPEGGYALGFNPAQLNLENNSTDQGNQLASLAAAGCFVNPTAVDPARSPKLASQAGTDYPLGYRARSYLAANCSQCHQPGAPAGQSWDARISTPLALAGMIGVPAASLDSTLTYPVEIIAPHSVEASMIVQWMNRRGVFQMPPMGTTLIDTNGIQLLTDWINSFPGDPWRDAIVGATNVQGYTAVQGDALELSASGDATSDSTNTLYFSFVPLQANGQFLARLSSFNPASASAQAGLICRLGLDSADGFLAIVQAGDGSTYLQRRSSPGAGIETQPIAAAGAAQWLRIVRQESNLAAYFSSDGAHWSVGGTVALSGGPQVDVGLAIGPSASAAFSTAVFTNTEFVTVTLKEPLPDQTFTSPGVIPMSADVFSLYAQPLTVEFYAGSQRLGAVANPQDQFLWTNPNAGTYSVRARITDGSGAFVFSEPIYITVQLADPIAQFHQQDGGTMGNWKGVYGEDAAFIPGRTADTASVIKLMTGTAQTVVVNPSTEDENALQRDDELDRVASFWTTQGPLSLELQLNDAQLHRVALYFADFNGPDGRTQQVQLFDARSGRLLDTQTVGGFSAGQYLVWLLRGDIRIDITSDQAPVLSGVFVDPFFNLPPIVTLNPLPWQTVGLPVVVNLQATATDPDGAISRVEFFDGTTSLGSVFEPPYTLNWPGATVGTHQLFARAFDDLGEYTDSPPVQIQFEPAAASVQFLGIDPVTEGDWKPRYNRFAIALSATNYPSTVAVSFVRGDLWPWTQASDSPAALQNVTDEYRTAAAWSGDEVYFRVDCLDGAFHQLALYFLDWASAGRVESIVLTDPASTTVLDSRTISDFARGQYYIWKVQGSVVIDIHPETVNAVLSGLFFEPNDQQPLALTWLRSGDLLSTSLALRGPPGKTARLQFSANLHDWTVWSTNTVPESGILFLPSQVQPDGNPGFYQAELISAP